MSLLIGIRILEAQPRRRGVLAGLPAAISSFLLQLQHRLGKSFSESNERLAAAKVMIFGIGGTPIPNGLFLQRQLTIPEAVPLAFRL